MKNRMLLGIGGLIILIVILIAGWAAFRPKQYIFVCNDASASSWQVKINGELISSPLFAAFEATQSATLNRCQKITLPLSISRGTVDFTKQTGLETTTGSEVVDFTKNSYVYAHVANNVIWITQSKDLIPSLARP